MADCAACRSDQQHLSSAPAASLESRSVPLEVVITACREGFIADEAPREGSAPPRDRACAGLGLAGGDARTTPFEHWRSVEAKSTSKGATQTRRSSGLAGMEPRERPNNGA